MKSSINVKIARIKSRLLPNRAHSVWKSLWLEYLQEQNQRKCLEATIEGIRMINQVKKEIANLTDLAANAVEIAKNYAISKHQETGCTYDGLPYGFHLQQVVKT